MAEGTNRWLGRTGTSTAASRTLDDLDISQLSMCDLAISRRLAAARLALMSNRASLENVLSESPISGQAAPD